MIKAQADPSDSLVFECDFEEPPEKVWRALTEPRLLQAWLTADEPSRTDATEERSRPRQPQPRDYEVLTAEPHRLLRYRWRDRERAAGDAAGREVHSIVTFELAAGAAGGTHLRLTHGEFRIVSAAACVTAARVRPITSGRRRRAPILSCATASLLRRAA